MSSVGAAVKWACFAIGLALSGDAAFVNAEHQPEDADHRTSVRPKDVRSCPTSHPIKGNFTTYSGERCIYHAPGWEFYNVTHPERCYATEAEARQDGCRPSRRR